MNRKTALMICAQIGSWSKHSRPIFGVLPELLFGDRNQKIFVSTLKSLFPSLSVFIFVWEILSNCRAGHLCTNWIVSANGLNELSALSGRQHYLWNSISVLTSSLVRFQSGMVPGDWIVAEFMETERHNIIIICFEFHAVCALLFALNDIFCCQWS